MNTECGFCEHPAHAAGECEQPEDNPLVLYGICRCQADDEPTQEEDLAELHFQQEKERHEAVLEARRAALLGNGRPAWWFLRDVTKAHLAVDTRPLSWAHPDGWDAPLVVLFRCGLRDAQDRLERPWSLELNGRDAQCRLCSQGGVIR